MNDEIQVDQDFNLLGNHDSYLTFPDLSWFQSCNKSSNKDTNDKIIYFISRELNTNYRTPRQMNSGVETRIILYLEVQTWSQSRNRNNLLIIIYIYQEITNHIKFYILLIFGRKLISFCWRHVLRTGSFSSLISSVPSLLHNLRGDWWISSTIPRLYSRLTPPESPPSTSGRTWQTVPRPWRHDQA